MNSFNLNSDSEREELIELISRSALNHQIENLIIPTHGLIESSKATKKLFNLSILDNLLSDFKIYFASYIQQNFESYQEKLSLFSICGDSMSELLILNNRILLFVLADLNDIFETFLGTLDESRKQVISMRVEGHTLEFIGNLQGVTRERIRQMEKNVIGPLVDFILYPFTDIIKNRGYAYIQDLEVFGLNDSNLNLMIYALKTKKEVKYLKKFEVLIMSDQIFALFEELDKRLKLSDFFSATEMDNILNDFSGILTGDKLDTFFELFGFVEYQGEYIKRKAYKKFALLIIENHFPKGIELRQNYATEDFIKFTNLLKTIYNYKVEISSSRTFLARIMEFLYAIDRSIYLTEKQFSRTNMRVNFVIDYLTSKPNYTHYLIEVYNIFKERLKEVNINNQYHLRSVLRYAYSNIFFIDRDSITYGEANPYPLSSRILDYLEKKGMYTFMDDILTHFSNFSNIMIYTAIEYDSRLVQISKDILAQSILISEDKVKLLFMQIDKLVQSSSSYFVSMKELTQEISFNIFNEDVKFFVNPYNILKAYKYNSYIFFEEGIYRQAPENDSSISSRTINLITKDSKWNYYEMKRFLNKITFNPNSHSVIYRRYLSMSIRLNEDDFVLIDKFNLKHEDLEYLRITILEKLEDSDCLSIKVLKTLPMPDFGGYSSNIYLTISVIQKFLKDEYSVLFPLIRDRFIREAIVVKNSFLSFNDYVYNRLKNLDVNTIHEDELKHYLKTHSIITDDLPVQLIEDERFGYNSGYFNLK